MGIPPGSLMPGLVQAKAADADWKRIAPYSGLLKRMARFSSVEPLEFEGRIRIEAKYGDTWLYIPLSDFIDVDAERDRLSKAAFAAEKERDSLAQRLANPNFTERAKPEAVEKARADHEAKSAEAERLRAALERLG
jgi:valyl-tRNA synthetase